MADRIHDVIVIGAGVAGVSTAIECSDIQLDVLLFESADRVGGQIEEVPHTMRNVVTSADGNDKLLAALAQHASTLGDRLRLGDPVHSLDLAIGSVTTRDGGHRAKSVLIATGSRRRELGIAPEGSFGGDVTYLIEPQFQRFAGHPMVVVGGGDSAALDALALADTGSQVTLVHRSPHLSSRHDIAERLRSSDRITDLAGWDVDELVGRDRLRSVKVSNPTTGERREIEAGGIDLKLGREAHRVGQGPGRARLARRDHGRRFTADLEPEDLRRRRRDRGGVRACGDRHRRRLARRSLHPQLPPIERMNGGRLPTRHFSSRRYRKAACPTVASRPRTGSPP